MKKQSNQESILVNNKQIEIKDNELFHTLNNNQSFLELSLKRKLNEMNNYQFIHNQIILEYNKFLLYFC